MLVTRGKKEREKGEGPKPGKTWSALPSPEA